MPFGFLTLARYQNRCPKIYGCSRLEPVLHHFFRCYKILKTWEDYEHIILAYSARSIGRACLYWTRLNLQEDFGSLVDNPAKLIFIPIVTREPVGWQHWQNDCQSYCWMARYKARAGMALDIDSTHVMLCGNPDMVEDTKEALKTWDWWWIAAAKAILR